MSSVKLQSSVAGLSWSQLNSTLLDCKDLPTLEHWLEEESSSGNLVRTLRVYGRLSVVRRAEELAALRKRLHANGKARHT